MSDGSDFIFGEDHVVRRTKKSLPKTCVKFFKTLAEIDKYQNLLKYEFNTNLLFQNGWNEALKIASSRNILNHGLTEEEKLALVTYTLKNPSVYEIFNKHTRLHGFYSPDYHFRAMYYFISSALKKRSAKTVGDGQYKVYRGVTYSVNDAVLGETFLFPNFASTSLKIDQAQNFLNKANGEKTLFIIDTTHGAKIEEFSRYPEEKEVLVSPCEEFQVNDIVDNKAEGRKEIYLTSKDLRQI